MAGLYIRVEAERSAGWRETENADSFHAAIGFGNTAVLSDPYPTIVASG
jgi:hypothetical protein